MKKSVKYTELSDEVLLEKWLSTFGKGVNKNIMEEYVTSHGNLLWYLFTWGEVPCLKGEDARKAFDELQYEEAIRFYDGKVVIGAAMLLSGVIELVGWFIACTLTVKPRGRSRVWGCLVQRF